MKKTRRKFIRQSSQAALGWGLLGIYGCGEVTESTKVVAETVKEVVKKPFFDISLAQWSLNRSIFGGKIDNLDFAATAKKEFDINAIEYVNQFFKDKAEDTAYLTQMKQRADDNGVKSLLIMIDREGGLANLDEKERMKAVENHYKWVNAAKFLGCHSIRVNAFGEGSSEDVGKAAVEGLGKLSEFAAKSNINVIVENHGSYSSDASWLANVMNQVNMSNCGTLPDFGNFCIERDGGKPWEGECINEYDRYKGVKEMMVHAKAVSAKAHDFDENGNEIHTDFKKMMQIVKDAGYTGWVGIEYEGEDEDEIKGIKATQALLKKVGMELG